MLASVLPEAQIRAYADAWTTNGRGDTLFSVRYGRLVTTLRVAASGCSILAAIVELQKRRLTALLPLIAAQVDADLSEIAAHASGAWRAVRSDLPALAGLVAIGAFLRMRFLSQPMSFDEALTYGTFAARPLLVTISHYAEPNNHIFHSVLVHLSCAVFGDRLWAVRLPALVAGLLAVPASYAAFRTVYDRRTGLLTAALVAALSPMVEFSIYSRGYMLIALFFLALTAIAAVQLRNPVATLWLPFAAVSALGFYTVPTMIYPFGIVLTWMAMEIFAERSSARVSWRQVAWVALASVALAAALYLPLAVVSGPSALLLNRWVGSVGWTDFVRALRELAWGTVRHWHQDLPAGAAFVLAAAFMAGIAVHSRRSRFRIPVVAAAVVWTGVALGLQRVVPYTRTWIFLLPLYAGTAAAGFATLLEWMTKRLAPGSGHLTAALVAHAVAAWLAVGLITHREAYRPSGGTFVDAPAIMGLVDQNARNGEIVIVSPASYVMFRGYARLRGSGFGRYTTRADGVAHGVVVVNEGWSETPEGNLAAAGVRVPAERLVPVARSGAATAFRWQAPFD